MQSSSKLSFDLSFLPNYNRFIWMVIFVFSLMILPMILFGIGAANKWFGPKDIHFPSILMGNLILVIIITVLFLRSSQKSETFHLDEMQLYSERTRTIRYN